MNHTLKRSIAKIRQETNLTWDKALPVALLQIKVAPRSRLKLSPFEILHGRPFQVSARAGASVNALKDLAVVNYVKALSTILTSVHEFASSRSAYPTEVALHPFRHGDGVRLKTWREQVPENQLTARGIGPHMVLLTMHSSVKLAGIKPWIHHTRIKAAPPLSKGDATPERPGEQWVCEPLEDYSKLFKSTEENRRKLTCAWVWSCRS